ncbi:unnamed protein product [Durusdinium trenchii]|uniref:Uncharacterized protein n=2 Tax=Durusdinium trenchii TaxID=1381693 RepID=A0ABP0L1U6_9DINO
MSRRPMSLEVAMAILKPPALDPSVEGPVAADEGVPGRGEGVQASVEEAPAPRPARPGAIPDVQELLEDSETPTDHRPMMLLLAMVVLSRGDARATASPRRQAARAALGGA